MHLKNLNLRSYFLTDCHAHLNIFMKIAHYKFVIIILNCLKKSLSLKPKQVILPSKRVTSKFICYFVVRLPNFHGVVTSFEQYPRDWNIWYTSSEPENTPLPGNRLLLSICH